jgi:hypothetical protein
MRRVGLHSGGSDVRDRRPHGLTGVSSLMTSARDEIFENRKGEAACIINIKSCIPSASDQPAICRRNGACNLCLLFPTDAVHCPTHHSGSTARNGNFCGGDRAPKRGTLYPQRPRDPNRCQEKPAKGGQNWQFFTNCQMARPRGGPGRTRTSNQTVMSGTPSPEKPEKSDD